MSSGVTVGIVTFERNKELTHLLKALKEQEREHQCVVVDGANLESTKSICEEHSAEYFSSAVNNLGANRRKIVESCKTPLLAFIDTDCLPVEKVWLSELVNQLQSISLENESVAGLCGGQIITEKNGDRSALNLIPNLTSFLGSSQSNFSMTREVDHVPTNNSIFWTSYLKKAGNFRDTFFNVGEDLMMGWDLKNLGFKIFKSSEKNISVMHAASDGWFAKMFGYGRAQVFAMRRVGVRPPMRFWISLFFLPFSISFMAKFPLPSFLMLLILQISLLVVGGLKLSSMKIIPTFFLYSMGMWRELILKSK